MELSDPLAQSQAQARAALEEAYGGETIDRTLDIRVGENAFSLTARECGLAYDISGSIDLAFAYGRQGGFLERARLFWSTRTHPAQLELVTVLDSKVLQARVDEMIREARRFAVESPYPDPSELYTDIYD